METRDLSSFVLLLVTVGLLIGVGIIIADKFGSTNFYERTDSNRSVSYSNQSVALGVGNLTSVGSVYNASVGVYPSTCYSIDSVNGSIHFVNLDNTTCKSFPAMPLHVIVDYKDYNTATASAMSNVSTEIGNIGSNWLGLIIVISILALIIGLIITSFGFGLGRR